MIKRKERTTIIDNTITRANFKPAMRRGACHNTLKHEAKKTKCHLIVGIGEESYGI